MRLRRAAALLVALCALAPTAGLVDPVVISPAVMRLGSGEWQVAALDLPAGADISLSLTPRGGGAAVAFGSGVAGSTGAASLSLSISQGGAPTPGPYLLTATSVSASWRQTANVTLVSGAPFLVRQQSALAGACLGPSSAHSLASCLAALQTVLTDKAVYKPGDTVLLRVLALSSLGLRPAPGLALRLSVKDPSGFKVAQTVAATDPFGVASWEVPTSAEPPLGEWSVLAEGPTSSTSPAERPFRLDKYVLPTFAVRLQPAAPGYLVQPSAGPAGGALEGLLSAAHTNGAPVQGTVLLTLAQPTQHSYGWSGGAAAGGFARPLPADFASSSPAGGSGLGPAPALLATQRLQLGAGGAASFRVQLPATAAGAGVNWSGGPLLLSATVTESATGETQNGTVFVPVSATPLTATLQADASFKPGLPWSITASFVAPDGAPPGPSSSAASAAAVRISASTRQGVDGFERSVPLALDASGKATVSLLAPLERASCCNRTAGADWAAQTCCIDYISAELTGVDGVSAYAGSARASVDTTGYFLAIGAVTAVGARGLSFTPAATTLSGAPISWAVLSPAGAVAAGSTTAGAATAVTLPGALGGGGASLLAWVRAGDSLVIDSVPLTNLPFSMEGLPANLTAAFNTTAASPGDPVALVAQGEPACRVFFAATDASVALMGADATLNASGILGAAAQADAAALSGAASADAGACWSQPPQVQAGAALATALKLPQCGTGGWRGGMMDDMLMAAMPMAAMEREVPTLNKDATSGAAASGGAAPAVRVRSFFPETWVWTSADADARGAASAPAAVPDTLTGWSLSAFSLHPQRGIAVAPPAPSLAVSQPFYMRATLPYSVVRGEAVVVNVGLFSNLSVPVTAQVTLLNASASGLALAGAATHSAFVGIGGASGVSFTVVPQRLGTLTLRFAASATSASSALLGGDALQATLLVQAEGLPAEQTHNMLLRATPAGAAATLAAPPPDSAVAGSARATLSIVGDIMGPSLANLGELLTIPTGCGEQNLITMAPNVAVLQYVDAVPTGSLPAGLLAFAKSNAALGFQRQLTFRHADGSFSAFGESDASGSTWLTAFALRVFSAAAQHVAVDAAVLSTAASFLAAQQSRSSGAFASVGNVIHTDMVGGVTSEVSLTAFVVAALLEAPAEASVPPAALAAALAYLRSHPAAQGDAYAQHTRTYALARACASRPDAPTCADADAALASLTSQLTPASAAALPHWEAPRSAVGGDGASSSSWQAVPADIELTGYGVLSLLARGKTADATSPARWLISQRSGLGGYGSTQDTVVGLQALAGFAAATYGAPPHLVVRVAGAQPVNVSVDAGNAALLQQLDVAPGQPVMATVVGEGTVLLQLTTRYNVLPPGSSAGATSSPGSLQLTSSAVNVTTQAGPASGRRQVLLADGQAAAPPTRVMHMRSCLSRAQGASAARAKGMVVLQVGLFSGFAPVAASLQAVRASAPQLVKRYEVDPAARKVSFYLESVSSADGQVCVAFDTVQEEEVTALQPASSTAYSYYAPQDGGGASLRATSVPEATARPSSGVTVSRAPPGGQRSPAVRGAAPRPWWWTPALLASLAAVSTCACAAADPQRGSTLERARALALAAWARTRRAPP